MKLKSYSFSHTQPILVNGNIPYVVGSSPILRVTFDSSFKKKFYSLATTMHQHILMTQVKILKTSRYCFDYLVKASIISQPTYHSNIQSGLIVSSVINCRLVSPQPLERSFWKIKLGLTLLLKIFQWLSLHWKLDFILIPYVLRKSPPYWKDIPRTLL